MRKISLSFIASLIFIFFSAVSLAQVDVTSTGGTSPLSYTTLKAAFDAINAGTHTGTITISITGNTDEGTATATLNASGSGSASYTSITISPSGGAARTISGATTPGNPMIDFNGADNVTIDGLNTGGNSLTISNTTVSATSGTSTIRFIGGATNNTITNCNLQGSVSSSVATNGAVVFFSTDGSTPNGNDNNTISNCDIGPAGANLPTKGILGNGSITTTAIGNSGIVIDNNNIFDYFGAAVTSAGIAINGGCNTWTITNNRFYQTATRTWTTGAEHNAILLNSSAATSGVQGMTVTGNIIGYASNSQTGTYTLTGSTGIFRAIRFNGITGGTISNINSNTIASVSLTGVTSSGTSTSSPFSAILINNGLVNTNSNTIGSQSATGSLTFSTTTTSSTDVYGIYNFSVDDWTANSNNIGGISVTNAGASGTFIIYGMRANTSTSKVFNAASNNIGGTVANSIQLNATGTSSQVVGLVTSNAAATFTSNVIRNLTTNIGTGTTSSASMIGMMSTTTSTNHTFSQNTIYNLTNTNTTAATVVTGIQFTGGTANVVERNFIYGLTTSTNSTSAEVNGIRIAGGTTIYRNNMIAIGSGIGNAIGGAASNSSVAGIVGINEVLGTNSIFHNSVYIGGTATAGSGSSYAFNGVQTVNTRSFRNNIFFNARTNSGATGKHYAVKINGTDPNPTGLTINNNVYYVNGTGGVFGFFNSADVADLAAWKTAVGQDAQSFSADPQYNDPTNATPDLHLHPTNPTVAEGNGVDVGVTDDYDGQTRASLTPVDIGADAGNFTGLDLLPPAISYTLLGNSTSTTTRSFTNVTITDASGVNGTAGTRPRVYYKKSTDPNTFNDNTSGTTGWKYVEANGATSPFDFTIDYSLLNSAPVVAGDVIQYFVVAQDLATTPNVGINSGTFTATPSSVALTSAAFPIGGTINSYTIATAFSGSYNVGTGETYTTLTGAGGFFAAINANVVTGNITVNIVSDLTEDGTNALNQTAEEGIGGYTITIVPNAATERLISAAFAGGMIRLSGADRVTFDGRFSGSGKFLRFRNTSTTGQTFVFLNDATNNTIRDCYIEGANTSTTSGTILFSTSTGTSGNSNNTIMNCDVRDRSDAAGVPANAIYSSGTAGAPNANNTISGCNIFNWTNAGVLVSSTGAGNGWVINPSSFYQTAARAAALNAISIQGGSGHTITGNSIGGSASDRSGAPMTTSSGVINGINLTVGTTPATTVSNNTIANINNTGTSFPNFHGILVAGGNVNITNNTIGGAANAWDTVRTNEDTYCIRNTGSGTVLIQNNTIGNIRNYLTTIHHLRGIRVSAGVATIIGNTIRDMYDTGPSSTTFFMSGIDLLTATAGNVVQSNTIYNLHQANAGASIFNLGIFVSSVTSTPTPTLIHRNHVYNLTGAGTPALLYGIYKLSGSATYYNNMIALGSTVAENHFIGGIRDDGATGSNNWYFNSVSISGTSGAGSNSTFAFFRSSSATVDIKNNIFSNTRTGGTGAHIAIANTHTDATGWGAGASNWNILNGTASTIGQWLSTGTPSDFPTWQTNSSGDANSRNIQPNFVSATDLHLVAGSNCGLDGYGTPIAGITTDYDNDTRDATTPDIGADEFTAVYSGTLAGVAGTPTCENKTVSPAGTTYATETCGLIARVVPSGSSPVSGKVNVCVTLDATQQYYNGQPYVQRRVDIEPATGAATATATVTLYFTDAEFENYNTNNPTWPALPTVAGGGNSDPNRANLVVTQFHGTATSSPSAPGAYTGAAEVIDPDDANIFWNGTYWSVTFDVTGFSGFYVHSSKAFIPVKAFLQGAYSTGLTRHQDVTSTWASVLNTHALSQPYNTAPFSYSGTESVSSGFFTSTSATTDIVDWVLLELRNSANPAVVVARRAAFIREDGRIVDLDGTSDVYFKTITKGNYFLVIRHRNHLAIRSSVVLTVNGALGASAPPLYDFTTAQSQAFQNGAITTNPAMKDLGSSVFGMWAGDVNRNNVVRYTGLLNDAAALLSLLGGNQAAVLNNVYSPGDLNMNGNVRFTGLGNDAAVLLSVLGGNQAAVFTGHQ